MDLFKDILIGLLSKHDMKVVFENLELAESDKLVEMTCYETILRIRNVLENNDLDDFECIERIVVLLEAIGSNGGGRHDFG